MNITWEYVFNFAFSLVVTAVSYGAFPMIYARVKTGKITGTQYTKRCYAFNILIFILFKILGSTSTGGAYFLWTSAFVSISRNKLNKIYIDPDSKQDIIPAQRYCKLCGGIVDRNTKKCTNCGKQYFNSKKALNIAGPSFAALALVVLSLTCILQSVRYAQCQATITELEDQLASSAETIASQQERLNDYQDKVISKNKKINSLIDEIDSLEDSLNFYQKHIVVVPDEYPRIYHRYECALFLTSNASFWAYNTEAAKSMGYQACSRCID